jgi:quercetin dioxygenase-like cupin family protein
MMSEISTVQSTILQLHTIPTIRNVHGPVTTIELDDGELWRAEGDHRWSVIICLEGMVWLTQERDWRDYVLTAGDVFIVTQPGKVVASAKGNATLQLSPTLATAPYAGDVVAFP